MKIVKYAFLALLAIVLVTLAIANRAPVELQLLPAALTDLLGFQERISLPLYVVIFGAIVVGLLIGFVWEWIREWRIRRMAERRARELRVMERENARLRREKLAEQGEDEVLALLDEPAKRPATGTAVART
jgi:uncharacterized integral membrane protein